MSDWYTSIYGDDWKIDSDLDVYLEHSDGGHVMLSKQDLLEMLKVIEEYEVVV